MKPPLSLLLMLLIISCSSNSDETKLADANKQEEKQQKELKETNKLKTIAELTKKYNIQYKIDTIHKRYSIDYDPVIHAGVSLIDKFIINDIYKADTTYYISIWPYNLIKELILRISKEQLLYFENAELDHILIVNITKIKKIRFTIEGVPEDEENASADLENSHFFSANGILVDMVSLEK